MRFFRAYQFIAPFLTFPVAYGCWLRRYDGDHTLALLIISIPILWSYIIPAVGMNVLKLWDFNTRFKIGRIRPHHGFLFGSATSLFGLLCLDRGTGSGSYLEALRSGLVLGSVVAFWNWLYDLHAIRVGFIRYYNLKYSQGLGPADITSDYAPVMFGMFGLCYGFSIRMIESAASPIAFWKYFTFCNLGCIFIPPLCFLIYSYSLIGESGLHSYQGTRDEPDDDGAFCRKSFER